MTPLPPQPHTFQPDIYGKVLPFLPDGPGRRVLDVGAGQGYFSRILKDRGYAVDACDAQPENFRCPDVPFLKADLNRSIPCADGRYDAVVSIETIEHIEDHFRFMGEIVRVTRPGGVIIITTPNVLSLTSRWHFFLYGTTDCAPLPIDPGRPDHFMEHINPIGLPEILFHLERHGAELEALATNRMRRSAWIPFLLLYPLLALALRRKLLRGRYGDRDALHRRHLRWMLRPANLLGRITIAVARRRSGAPV
jgi:SAM-dependent methyltransferase